VVAYWEEGFHSVCFNVSTKLPAPSSAYGDLGHGYPCLLSDPPAFVALPLKQLGVPT
jgi:hypothetical protein